MKTSKKSCIYLAEDYWKRNNMHYAVVPYKKGFTVMTLQSAKLNGCKIVFSTETLKVKK